MRAIGGIVTAWGNQLDGVHTENHHVAVILLPHGQRPAIVRIGLGPKAELMTAQGVSGSARNLGAVVQLKFIPIHLERAQEAACGEDRSPTIMSGGANSGR